MKVTLSKPIFSENGKGIMITLILLYITYLYLFTTFSFPFIYEFLIIVNSSICIWNIVNIRHEPYSLRMLVNFFIFVFFILANAIQFGNHNNVLTFQYSLTNNDFSFFQFIIFFILVIFNGLYDIFKSIEYKSIVLPKINYKKSVYLSLIVTFLILLYFRFNPYALLLRGFVADMLSASRDSEAVGAGPIKLIFDHFIRPIPWAIFLVNIIVKGNSKKNNTILFLCALITVFPTGLARNAAAMFWIPVFIIYFRKFIKGRNFIWVMFAGIFIAFPLLDNFRNFDGTVRHNAGLDYLNNMNFDASQIFMTVLDTGLTTFGKQLAGVFLFFVPRSIWATKPIGSGAFLVDNMGGWFSNVSMPYFAEGYINFGYFGILLFIIILAYGSKKLDSCYWLSKNHGSLFQGYYLILLGAIMFIMRGDMMSSFAYTLGLLVCYFVVTKLIIIKPKKKSFMYA